MQPQSPPKTVVFDLGAVLLRWQPAEIVQHELARHAPTAAAAQLLCERIFQGLHPGATWAEFDRGTVEPAPLAALLAAQSGVDAADLLRFIHAIPNHLPTQQDTAALLPRLKAQGHRLVYLSNMPTSYADRLQDRDFFNHFEDGIFSAHVGLIKPEHGIYALAESQFGLTPADTVFIDDNAHNVATAHARGWQAIQFLDAAQCERDLVALGWLE
ncbi:HAD family phosphatase [Rhodoferax sp.]|uniref:HAD family hydrolase n=1 Tax=Rhodoferax sp. TaxID=50421 RepID=UPI0025D88B44|nr:HAD family phosphatase [Rhodoferax sp.]